MFIPEHVLTLYTPRTSTQNLYSAWIFVVQLRMQDFDFLNYLLANVSEDTTRVSGKVSVWGKGRSFKGEGRENRFNMKSKSLTQKLRPGLRLTTAQ